jgi:hypothetical protein
MGIGRFSGAALLAVVLAGMSSAAYAVPETIDFEDVTAGTTSNFNTVATGLGTYTVTITAGSATVDTAAGAAALCSLAGGSSGCSDSGSQALYVFDAGEVKIAPAAGFLLTLNSFKAAVAAVSVIVPNVLDVTSGTGILVTGQKNAAFGGGTVTTAPPISLAPPADEFFALQTLSGFTNLDWVTFTFDNSAAACTDFGCGIFPNFAIDDLSVSSDPAPTEVPEPGTLGLLGFGIAGMGWARRRMKRRAA